MTTRDQRRRILEVLRLQGDDLPPRVPGPEARRRILEVMRLEAGLPLDVPRARRPGGKGPPIDMSWFERERARTKARRQARRRALRALGLEDDEDGRTLCLLCREVVATPATGLRGISPSAAGRWHRTRCLARAP